MVNDRLSMMSRGPADVHCMLVPMQTGQEHPHGMSSTLSSPLCACIQSACSMAVLTADNGTGGSCLAGSVTLVQGGLALDCAGQR